MTRIQEITLQIIMLLLLRGLDPSRCRNESLRSSAQLGAARSFQFLGIEIETCLRRSNPDERAARHVLTRNTRKAGADALGFSIVLRDPDSNRGLEVMSLPRYHSSIPLGGNFICSTRNSGGYESY